MPSVYLRFSILLCIILGDNKPPLFPRNRGCSSFTSNGHTSKYSLIPSQITGNNGTSLYLLPFPKILNQSPLGASFFFKDKASLILRPAP